MALTIKHLNSDASFLLSFEPIIPESIAGSVVPRPFTILLDPWITGQATVVHPKLSTTSHKRPACISSLEELTSPPDLVVISQHKSDHCNETTLRQLPSSGTKTLILAEAATTRLIRSWKYFDKEKIRTLEPWEDPRETGKQCVIRIPVPALKRGSGEGEVTVAYIPQRRDFIGLHGAIGITYRPPPIHTLVDPPRHVKILTPPSTPTEFPDGPRAPLSDAERKPPSLTATGDTSNLPPTPPISPLTPRSLRSTRSASTLLASSTHSLYSPSFRPLASSHRNETTAAQSLTPYAHSRPISVVFSPHGIDYSHLAPYATSHLVAEAALPLTALLHCMDSVTNPCWLGGNISFGVPCGAEIAAELGARLWISAHDGDKDVRGLVTGMLKTRRWSLDEIEAVLESRLSSGKDGGSGVLEKSKRGGGGGGDPRQRKGSGTEILRLTCGEEIIVTGTGRLWRGLADDDDHESENNVRLDSRLITETRIAPPPVPTSILKIPAASSGATPGDLRARSSHCQKGKYFTNIKKAPEESSTTTTAAAVSTDLPQIQIQSAMSPRKQGIYKVLSTKDLIMPSPRLTMERRDLTPTLTPIPTTLAPTVARTAPSSIFHLSGDARRLKKNRSHKNMGRDVNLMQDARAAAQPGGGIGPHPQQAATTSRAYLPI
ncbi:hypothetical protein F5Y17DRAFT_334931 [Xylariaceae sp. FL0594]|nr:hypothetical protein F5Y17DRAFT_334931 [Xylariaceae sp. FL0594]